MLMFVMFMLARPSVLVLDLAKTKHIDASRIKTTRKKKERKKEKK